MNRSWTVSPLLLAALVGCRGDLTQSKPEAELALDGSVTVSIQILSRAVTFALLANPYDTGRNTVSEVLPKVPSGTTLYSWNGFDYQSNFFTDRWSNSDEVIPPGAGFWLTLPATAPNPTTLTFTGSPSTGSIALPGAGAMALVGSPLPRRGLLASELGYPIASGDRVYRFDQPSQTFRSYLFWDGEWTPQEPRLEVAESVWIRRTNSLPDHWTQTPMCGTEITSCHSGDGCCPAGCIHATDSDCVASQSGQLVFADVMVGAGTPYNRGNAVAADAQGNAIVAGLFTGASIDFGTGPISSAGGYDGYLAKFDSAGVLKWFIHLGGPGDDSATGVAVDSQGNILVTGSFMGEVDFGGKPLIAPKDRFGFYRSDAFVAKYKPSGELLWARSFGGEAPDSGNAVAVDANDNIIFSAQMQGDWNTGLDDNGHQSIAISAGSVGVGLVKLDKSGTLRWGAQFGSDAIAEGLAVDAQGDIALVGTFFNQTDLGDGMRVGAGFDVWMRTVHGSNGTLKWAKTFGSTGQDNGHAIAIDPSTQNIIIAGEAGAGTIDFGNNPSSENLGGRAFIAAFKQSGDPVWSRIYSTGSSYNYSGGARGVRIDRAGNLAITGYAMSIDFSGGTAWPMPIGNGNINLFVAAFKVTGDGAPQYRWQRAGAHYSDGRGFNGSSFGTSLCFDSSGHALVAGGLSGTVDFGGIDYKTSWLASSFVASYSL